MNRLPAQLILLYPVPTCLHIFTHINCSRRRSFLTKKIIYTHTLLSKKIIPYQDDHFLNSISKNVYVHCVNIPAYIVLAICQGCTIFYLAKGLRNFEDRLRKITFKKRYGLNMSGANYKARMLVRVLWVLKLEQSNKEIKVWGEEMCSKYDRKTNCWAMWSVGPNNSEGNNCVKLLGWRSFNCEVRWLSQMNLPHKWGLPNGGLTQVRIGLRMLSDRETRRTWRNLKDANRFRN